MIKIIVILMAMIACLGYTQAQSKAEKARLKAERKAMQAKADSLMFVEAKQCVADSCFVLEAERLTFKHGVNLYVSSNTNFVAVQGPFAIVQVAFNTGRVGLNGLGGVTVEGRISRYEVTFSKKGEMILRMDVNGIGISAQVKLTLQGDANKCSVDIFPNFHSQRLSLDGYLIPPGRSNVFKGFSL